MSALRECCQERTLGKIFIKNSQIIIKAAIEFSEKSGRIATVLKRTLIKRRKLS